MSNVLKKLIGVCLTVITAFLLVSINNKDAEALSLKAGNKKVTVTSSPRSTAQAYRFLLNAAQNGTPVIVTGTPAKNGRVNLRLYGKNIKINVVANRKNKALEVDMTSIGKLLALLATLQSGSDSDRAGLSEKFPSQIRVYKIYSVTACQVPTQEVSDLDNDLVNAGVRSFSSYCAVHNSDYIASQPCGQPILFYRVHSINYSHLDRARLAGFRPLSELKTPIQEVQCPNATTEMVGAVVNKTCEPVQNTVEQLDKRLSDAGLKVLSAECGGSTASAPTVCGLPDAIFRSVKIFVMQRPLALTLGLKDKDDYAGRVIFGQQCPKVTPPAVPTVDMVGVLTNISCQPLKQSVASFDKMLVDNGIRVVQSSCGYSIFGTLTVCDTEYSTYRLVTIPAVQEQLALGLGLKSSSTFPSWIRFGQTCTENSEMPNLLDGVF